MKITRSQLKQIIKEELSQLLEYNEAEEIRRFRSRARHLDRQFEREQAARERARERARAARERPAPEPTPKKSRWYHKLFKQERDWSDNPVCQTYEEELATVEALYKAERDPAAKKVALKAYRTLKHKFEKECLKTK